MRTKVNWYSSKRWQLRRLQQLQHDPLCAMCLKDNQVTAATVADHVVPHRGDPTLFWQGELQSLCSHHHNSHKQQLETKGYTNEIGLDGWPTHPNHPANAKRQLV